MVAVLEPLDQRALCGTGTASMAPAFAQRADGAAKGPARQAPCHDEERNWPPNAPIIIHSLIDHVPTSPPEIGPVYKSSSGHRLLTCSLFLLSSCPSIDVRLHPAGGLLLSQSIRPCNSPSSPSPRSPVYIMESNTTSCDQINTTCAPNRNKVNGVGKQREAQGKRARARKITQKPEGRILSVTEAVNRWRRPQLERVE